MSHWEPFCLEQLVVLIGISYLVNGCFCKSVYLPEGLGLEARVGMKVKAIGIKAEIGYWKQKTFRTKTGKIVETKKKRGFQGDQGI